MKYPKIFVYTVPHCPKCRQVFSYFNERDIPYTEIDVLANNKQYAREMIEKSGQKSVPVVEIDGHIIVGFQPHEFEKLFINSK